MASIEDLTPGTWTIDGAHSNVGFTARHVMIAKVRGRFGAVTGTITVPEDRMAATVEATIEMTSVDTGDEGRDGHLRSPDFFDVETHPTMTFASTGIVADGKDLVLHGDLTIKGTTKPVELDLEFEGVGGDPWGGTRAGFTAEGELNRKDWGLDFNMPLEGGGVVVSDKIKLTLDVEAVKAEVPAEAGAGA